MSEHHPTLNWELRDVRFSMAFGYLDGVRTAALFVGDQSAPVAFLPDYVLQIAAQQGWIDEDDAA